MTDLTEYLRVYDILGLWREAENVIRRELVQGFVKKVRFPYRELSTSFSSPCQTIFYGATNVPHSPILPHTPFPSRQNTLDSHPPRTPYTPFSAFVPKQNTEPATSTSLSQSPYAHLLSDTENPLARLYNQILRFVERDLSRIMSVAEKVSLKSVLHMRQTDATQIARSGRDNVVPSRMSEEGFEIMANVVWAEIGKAIMDELGGTVFAVGRPDDFRKVRTCTRWRCNPIDVLSNQHHQTTTAFIRSLEFLAPSVQSIKALRSHPVYLAFDRRWQLPVYFQMRWKEIVNKVEEALSTTRIDFVLVNKGMGALATLFMLREAHHWFLKNKRRSRQPKQQRSGREFLLVGAQKSSYQIWAIDSGNSLCR
jgi:hypothetical protein